MTAAPIIDFYTIAQGETHPWSYHLSEAEAVAKLAELTTADPAKWAGGRAIPCDQYFAEREAFYLEQPAVEITAEHFHQMLNVLPPLGWTHADGVERFAMRELTAGRITQQFARRDGRYLARYIHVDKRETFITAADFDTLTTKTEA